MRILIGHNFYQLPGGEDNVFADETAMLESKGHQVIRYTRHNNELTAIGSLRTAAVTLWNGQSFDQVKQLVEKERPELCHFHNTFPLMSPSVFSAVRAAGVPVVMTLHNYRLVCPAGTLERDGKICEDCVGSAVPWQGVAHACYRNSRSASAGVAALLSLHRLLGTWKNKIDLYITLTDFARKKMIQGGLPAEKIMVKPNFIHPDPGFSDQRSNYALFVGRLTPEKGIYPLLEAWKTIGERVPLRIIGDGPAAADMKAMAAHIPGVSFLGQLPRTAVLDQMKGASVLIFPSIWYEGFGLTIIEAFATGLPVIASNLGSVAEIVTDEKSGMLFTPGAAAELADKVLWLTSHREQMAQMGRDARREFEQKYTREINYELLMNCYRSAQGGHSAHRVAATSYATS